MDFLFCLQHETSFSGSGWSSISCHMLPSAGRSLSENGALSQRAPSLPVMVYIDVRGFVTSDRHRYFTSFHSCFYLYCPHKLITITLYWASCEPELFTSSSAAYCFLWQPTEPLDSLITTCVTLHSPPSTIKASSNVCQWRGCWCVLSDQSNTSFHAALLYLLSKSPFDCISIVIACIT